MTKTVLKIDGMMCGMCESHINDCIRKNFSVDKVTTSHSKGQSVILSKEPLDEDKIRSVIADTGYTLPSSVSVRLGSADGRGTTPTMRPPAS